MGNDLYFVIFRDEDQWVAMGLQHQVMTQGRDFDEIRKHIRLILRAYHEVVGIESLKRLPPAPPEYWERFIRALKNGYNIDDLSNESEVPPNEPAFMELEAA